MNATSSSNNVLSPFTTEHHFISMSRFQFSGLVVVSIIFSATRGLHTTASGLNINT